MQNGSLREVFKNLISWHCVFIIKALGVFIYLFYWRNSSVTSCGFWPTNKAAQSAKILSAYNFSLLVLLGNVQECNYFIIIRCSRILYRDYRRIEYKENFRMCCDFRLLIALNNVLGSRRIWCTSCGNRTRSMALARLASGAARVLPSCSRRFKHKHKHNAYITCIPSTGP